MKNAVLITGSSRGIGLEIAKKLSSERDGFKEIVMVARASETFSSAVEKVRGLSNSARIVEIEADFSNPDVIDSIYEELKSKGIVLDTIINNAGFTKPASIVETSLADFEHTMRVNLYAPFKFVQGALRRNHPLKQIVNIASTAGINGRSGWLSYSASKAALINMSEVLRDELNPYGIDVVCLSPGRCATDLRRTLAPEEDPLTIMQPEQVASIVQLMVSNTGKLLMSQNLVVRT